MDTANAVEEYLAYLTYRKNRPHSTIYTYKRILKEFTACVENIKVEDLSISVIDTYAYMLNPLSPKTRRNKLYALRSFISYLYKKNLTNIKPEQIETPEVRGTQANYLTDVEVSNLLNVVTDVRDRAIIHCFLSTGVRVSELVNIRTDDMYKRTVIIREGKGGHPRPVFMSLEADAALNTYLKSRGDTPGFLFLNKAGEKLSRVYVSRMISLYAARAGIKKVVSAHTLRHTFATQYLEEGGRLEDVQQILGHKSIQTTMIYLHFTNDRLRKAYEKTMMTKSFLMATT